MERITDIWVSVYFTEPILLNVILLTFIISIIKRKKQPSFRWLPFYLGIFLLFFLADYAYTILKFPADQERFQRYQREVNFYITFLEMFVFTAFFFSELRSAILRKTLRAVCICTAAIFVLIYANTHLNHGFMTYSRLNIAYIVQLATLLIASAMYFVQLFREPPVSNLRNLPGFWIATGLSFYSLCTLPITIANTYFFQPARERIYVNLYSIIYIFYILLFILIIRSYLCRPSGTM